MRRRAGVGLACAALCFLAVAVQVKPETLPCTCIASHERPCLTFCLRQRPDAETDLAQEESADVPLPTLALKGGKVFDGWLKPAPSDRRHATQGAGHGESGDDDEESAADSDEGGEPWYEREHLAAPPAGWHRPVAKKAATKKHAAKREKTDVVNSFHGDGADASPSTIAEELQKGIKLFGRHRKQSFVAQSMHRKHRTIASMLADPKLHRHKAVDLPDRG